MDSNNARPSSDQGKEDDKSAFLRNLKSEAPVVGRSSAIAGAASSNTTGPQEAPTEPAGPPPSASTDSLEGYKSLVELDEMSHHQFARCCDMYGIVATNRADLVGSLHQAIIAACQQRVGTPGASTRDGKGKGKSTAPSPVVDTQGESDTESSEAESIFQADMARALRRSREDAAKGTKSGSGSVAAGEKGEEGEEGLKASAATTDDAETSSKTADEDEFLSYLKKLEEEEGIEPIANLRKRSTEDELGDLKNIKKNFEAQKAKKRIQVPAKFMRMFRKQRAIAHQKARSKTYSPYTTKGMHFLLQPGNEILHAERVFTAVTSDFVKWMIAADATPKGADPPRLSEYTKAVINELNAPTDKGLYGGEYDPSEEVGGNSWWWSAAGGDEDIAMLIWGLYFGIGEGEEGLRGRMESYLRFLARRLFNNQKASVFHLGTIGADIRFPSLKNVRPKGRVTRFLLATFGEEWTADEAAFVESMSVELGQTAHKRGRLRSQWMAEQKEKEVSCPTMSPLNFIEPVIGPAFKRDVVGEFEGKLKQLNSDGGYNLEISVVAAGRNRTGLEARISLPSSDKLGFPAGYVQLFSSFRTSNGLLTTQDPERKKGAKAKTNASLPSYQINLRIEITKEDILPFFSFLGASVKLDDLMSTNSRCLFFKWLWRLEEFKNLGKLRTIHESSFKPNFINKKIKEAEKEQQGTKGPELYKNGVRSGLGIPFNLRVNPSTVTLASIVCKDLGIEKKDKLFDRKKDTKAVGHLGTTPGVVYFRPVPGSKSFGSLPPPFEFLIPFAGDKRVRVETLMGHETKQSPVKTFRRNYFDVVKVVEKEDAASG